MSSALQEKRQRLHECKDKLSQLMREDKGFNWARFLLTYVSLVFITALCLMILLGGHSLYMGIKYGEPERLFSTFFNSFFISFVAYTLFYLTSCLIAIPVSKKKDIPFTQVMGIDYDYKKKKALQDEMLKLIFEISELESRESN